MNMNISDEQLCAYLDNELDPSTRRDIERALAQDSALQAKLALWSAQSTQLRDALDEDLDEPIPESWLKLTQAPAQTQTRTGPALRKQPPPSLAERLMQWLPSPRMATGLAFSVIVGIIIGKEVTPRMNMDGQLVRLASVAHHVYSPDKRQPVEVKGEDPTLVPWISKRLGAKVTPVNLTTSGFRFMGGRLLAGAEEPAGQFMYEDTAGKRITLFVRTEGAKGRSTDPECSAYRGVSVCYWYAGGVAYALSGEIDHNKLSALALTGAPATRAQPQ